MVKNLDRAEVDRDYQILWHEQERYLVPYTEIADFGTDTDHFRDVYKVMGDIDRGQRSHRFFVERVEDTCLLEAITETWGNKELGGVVSSHGIIPPSDFRG